MIARGLLLGSMLFLLGALAARAALSLVVECTQPWRRPMTRR